MLADMLPGDLRYDENARAVCLRLSDFVDAVTHARAATAEAEFNQVNAALTTGLR